MPVSPARSAIISPSNLFMSVIFSCSYFVPFSLLQISRFSETKKRDFSYSAIGKSPFLYGLNGRNNLMQRKGEVVGRL